MKTRIKHSLTMSLCSLILASLFACGGNGGGTSSNTNSQIPIGRESSSNTNSQIPIVRESISNTNTAISQNPLTGTWVSEGYSLTFKPDNMYSRAFNIDGIPAVRGSVTVSGNVIILTDSGSCLSSTTGRIESGSYTYNISGNTLTFSLFHDPCSDRAAFMGLTYTKQ